MDAAFEGLRPTRHARSATAPAARIGDREARGRELEAFRQYLLLVANRELDADLRAKEGASDIVQETLLEAHAGLDHFAGRSEGQFRAWLRRILLNNVANLRRRYRETAKRQIGLEVSIDDSGTFGPARANLVSPESSPSHQAHRQERIQSLALALERLPEHYRRVLLSRYQERQSFEEISRRSGHSPDAVRMLWARALKRLQQEVKSGSAEP